MGLNKTYQKFRAKENYIKGTQFGSFYVIPVEFLPSK
jgi:hypothetical protein